MGLHLDRLENILKRFGDLKRWRSCVFKLRLLGEKKTVFGVYDGCLESNQFVWRIQRLQYIVLD